MVKYRNGESMRAFATRLIADAKKINRPASATFEGRVKVVVQPTDTVNGTVRKFDIAEKQKARTDAAMYQVRNWSAPPWYE